MRRRADFTTALERGRRGRSARLVVHVASDPQAEESLVGFVVSRAVGNAVGRNVVKRRLRALMAGRLDRVPQGSRVVVRALPAAAGCASHVLGDDLDRALRAATSARRVRPARTPS